MTAQNTLIARIQSRECVLSGGRAAATARCLLRITLGVEKHNWTRGAAHKQQAAKQTSAPATERQRPEASNGLCPIC